MKLSKFEIKNYHQFKDLTLDLTYPEGHPKAGRPLEKVCFIGQSGTGKTTLLRLFKRFIVIAKNNERKFYGNFYKKNDISINSNITASFNILNSDYVLELKKLKLNHSKNRLIDSIGAKIKAIETAYFSIPADIRHDIDFEENIIERIEKIKPSFDKTYIELSGKGIQDIWEQIMYSLVEHQKEEVEYRVQLTYNEKNDVHTKIKEWKAKNKSPLEKIADGFLREILSVFSLEVDVDIKRIESINFIQLKRKGDNKIIPFEFLSTGTKQIILSLVPLYQSNTENSIVLVDEPERSLFPDIQRTIIKHYTDLAPKAQLFFATHSPIIAAQFEPCERFILSFDEEGNVHAIQGNAKEGDNSNNLLIKDFGLETTLLEKGLEKWNEFIQTRRKIKFEKDEDKKVELINKYMQLGTDYNFAIYEENNKK